MSSPKEKADEMYNKMDNVVGGGNYDAKQYALIAVDYVIRLAKRFKDPFVIKYWQEVKQEIELI